MHNAYVHVIVDYVIDIYVCVYVTYVCLLYAGSIALAAKVVHFANCTGENVNCHDSCLPMSYGVV